MNKVNKRLQELFNLYVNKAATEDEKNELWDYINDPVFDADISELIAGDYKRVHQEEGLNESQKFSVLQHVFQQEPKYPHKSVSLWLRIAGIAAAVAMVAFGLWFYTYKTAFRNDVVYNKDIAPGRNTATLMLANGKVISLSDAKTGIIISNDKFAYNDGSSLQEEPHETSSLQKALRNDVEMKTPRGGMYRVILSDGTKVWLNADSKLKFPSQFSGNKRLVALIGEGYFEVTKDKTRPFIVESRGQKVEVLGTHFNINSYADEGSVMTTLVEGSVRVASTSQIAPGNEVLLKPNQQSIFTSANLISVKEVDVNDILDWKNGDFIFKEESLNSLMQRVSRWYNVNVTYDQGVNKAKTFTGKVSRTKNISEILKAISNAGHIKFSIEGNTVTVKNY